MIEFYTSRVNPYLPFRMDGQKSHSCVEANEKQQRGGQISGNSFPVFFVFCPNVQRNKNYMSLNTNDWQTLVSNKKWDKVQAF